MIRKYLLPLLAALGVVIIIVAILVDNQPEQAARVVQLPQTGFANYVSGAGIVEAHGGNIVVGTPEPGIVTNLYVKWGDRVKAGDPLFKLDDRDLQARLIPALADVNEFRVKLQQARDQLGFAVGVTDSRAISKEEISNRRAAVAITGAALASAQARVDQIRMDIRRRTVRALLPGRILQINLRPGEFAASGALAQPLVLLGNDDRLDVRVDIDEFDASRIKPGAAAIASVRGAPQQQVQLRFERIEPYVTPKISLTGSGTERVDTRVLQVIYSFTPTALPAYIGQQMDVFIETPPAGAIQTSYPHTRDVRQAGHAS